VIIFDSLHSLGPKRLLEEHAYRNYDLQWKETLGTLMKTKEKESR
jgi:hypothetical protein